MFISTPEAAAFVVRSSLVGMFCSENRMLQLAGCIKRRKACIGSLCASVSQETIRMNGTV
jgi:hypothetical protein